MTTTITGTTITFNTGNTQSVGIGTTWGSVGSYTIAYFQAVPPQYSVSGGGTTTGAQLRYANQSATLGVYYNNTTNYYMLQTFGGPITTTSLGLSGTWRCIAATGSSGTATTPQFYVRIS